MCQDSTTLGLIGFMKLTESNLAMIDMVLSSHTSCTYYSRVMLSFVWLVATYYLKVVS